MVLIDFHFREFAFIPLFCSLSFSQPQEMFTFKIWLLLEFIALSFHIKESSSSPYFRGIGGYRTSVWSLYFTVVDFKKNFYKKVTF